jgi:predicted RNA-binding Zn-ribbon protein involved in translation (DUF1610 family)
MNESFEIKLNLLDNSHAFLNEAVTYALSAQGDVRKWQFAVLNLVQSLELSLKSLLNDIHPILVYENIDVPKHTVGPLQALDRLNHPQIADAKFSETERRRIKNAINLRNQMTHSEFTLKPEYATAKFFEIFGFVTFFQARHFECEIEDIITKGRLKELLVIKCAIKELAERAAQRISEEGIDGRLVFPCPNCDNETFVIQDDINTCYTCRHTEEVRQCRKCGNFMFDWQMHDFSNELDIDLCEGQALIANSYGYDYYEACFECIDEIKNDIAQQRADEVYHWEMEQYHWEQAHTKDNS